MASIQLNAIEPDNGQNSSTLPQDGHIKVPIPNNHATHMVRRPLDLVQIVEATDPGTVAFNLVLDITLEPALQQLAKYYTFYRFKKLDFEALATSPFGTASGAMQIAHIPDPLNIVPDQQNAVTQMVRQLGSRMARPRDNTLLTPALQKWRFCKPGVDPRLSAFGAIVGIVRAPPGTGDFAQWAVTIIAEIELSYPTIWDDTAVYTFYEQPFVVFGAATPTVNKAMIDIELTATPREDVHVPESFQFKTKRPLTAIYTYLDYFGRKTSVDLSGCVFDCKKVTQGVFKLVFNTNIPTEHHREKFSFLLDEDAIENFAFGNYRADYRPITAVNKYKTIKQNEH